MKTMQIEFKVTVNLESFLNFKITVEPLYTRPSRDWWVVAIQRFDCKYSETRLLRTLLLTNTQLQRTDFQVKLAT
jgi:hypothetical protein